MIRGNQWLGRILCVVALIVGSVAKADSLPIPSLDTHAAFLLEPWKENAPVLSIFTDPFCPYCIQALKRKDELKPYNAFLFWYPIFGEKSDKRVAEILRCSPPVSTNVIEAVISGKSPDCSGPNNQALVSLNKKMYEAYSPPGVPAYYMGGVKVSVAELKTWRKSVAVVVPTVSLDWSRYQFNRLDVNVKSLSKMIVLLPSNYQKTEKLMTYLKGDAKHEWFVFLDGDKHGIDRICQQLVGKCEAKELAQYALATEEIKLIFDLTLVKKPVLIMNGKILTENEVEKYVPFLQL